MEKLVLLSLLLTTALAAPQRVHFPRRHLAPTTTFSNPEHQQIVEEASEEILEEPNVVPVRIQSIEGFLPKGNYVPNEFEKRQNEAARYEFSSDVDDHINDLTQQRSESRNGLAVKGMYSYSDGYYKHTVHYVADENGYRVTGMEKVPLSDGPKVDLNGSASVSNAAHGTSISYRVHSVPVQGPVGKIVDQY